MLKIYSVYDKKLGCYMNPFVVQHEQQALRSLQTTVNSGDNQLSEYSEDFDLYYLGSFNESQGIFDKPDSGNPEFILNALSLRKEA